MLLGYTMPQYQTGDMPAENLWVKIRVGRNLRDVAIGVYCRLQALRRLGLRLSAN